MWRWELFKRVFRRKEVEVKDEGYTTRQKIGKKIYNVPDEPLMYAKIVYVLNEKTGKLEPHIKYFKRKKLRKKDVGLNK